jgi:hypothetical protein
MPVGDTSRNGDDFERGIGELLKARLPHCYLANVPVFPADETMLADTKANELDFIIHLRKGDAQILVIIECKNCRVTGSQDARGGFARPAASASWLAHYPDKIKDVKNQLRAQRRALLSNLEPIDRAVQFHAVVVCANAEGLEREPGYIVAQEPSILEMTLIREDRFLQLFEKLLEGASVFRVQQSEILRRIRLGQPVPALGHPEIYNAIEYCHRCRAFIDSEIFQHLDFKHERWAINGSAGMGKSVLLVYATMALITDRCIAVLKEGTRYLNSMEEHFQKIGLTQLEKRHVWVVAHTDKQRKMLEQMFARFNDLYSDIDPYIESRRVKPQFRVFGELPQIDDDCNVLLVDEAHDLTPDWERRVREWHEKPGNYLVIACDRHQKLRLSHDNARMIAGVNFSRSTTKLRRNYRNPFPAYAGCLGMLFRWFSDSGPKILPKDVELLDAFGFSEVFNETADRLLLRSRNDAHPANNWSHVLSSFPSVAAAYQQLADFPLRKEQVLWIRFSPEESGFNYENLQRWSYHSVHSTDAANLLDKYVKGQEFPVVVIEGVPRMCSWAEVSRAHPDSLAKARIEMWQARRLVYLAASRTNVFLYFILPADTPADVAEEFRLMFAQLGQHLEQPSPSGTLWEIRVSKKGELETLDDYLDAIEAETVVETVAAGPAVIAPAASESAATTEVISVPSSSSSPVAATTLPKTESASPEPVVSPAANSSPMGGVPVAVTPSPASAIPASPSTPPAPAPVPPTPTMKPGEVTVSALSKEIKRPVKVIISMLERHGWRDLDETKPVHREVALRILRREPQPAPAGLNSFADQLDGKLSKPAAAANALKK